MPRSTRLLLLFAAMAGAAVAQAPDAAADAVASSGDAFVLAAALPPVSVTVLRPGGGQPAGGAVSWAVPAAATAVRAPPTLLGRRALRQAPAVAAASVPEQTYAPDAAPGSARARAEAKLLAFQRGSLPDPIMEGAGDGAGAGAGGQAPPGGDPGASAQAPSLAATARQSDGTTLQPDELTAHRGDVPAAVAGDGAEFSDLRTSAGADGAGDADAGTDEGAVSPRQPRVEVVSAVVASEPAPPPQAVAAAAEVGMDATRLSAAPAQALRAGAPADVLNEVAIGSPQSMALSTPAVAAVAASSGTSVCVGGGKLLAVTGTAVSVHDAKDGTLLAGPTPLTAFFKDAGAGRYYGGRCVYDGAAKQGPRQFYVAALRRPAAGKRGPAARLVVATTTDGNPLSAWAGPFAVDADGLVRAGDADATGAPLPGVSACVAAGCDARSLALGLDGEALWATVELWSVPAAGLAAGDTAAGKAAGEATAKGQQAYVGALALGVPKTALRAGQPDRPSTAALSGFPQWARALTPSATEAGGVHDASVGGTEYLVAVGDGALAVWAVTGTTAATRGWAELPAVSAPVLLPSRAANDPARLFSGGVPRPATASGLPGAPPAVDVVAPRRLGQVSLANGHLWLATSTAVLNGGLRPVLGAAYSVLRPEVSAGGSLDVVVDDSGLVSVDGASLAAPSAAGSPVSQTGLLTFVVVGPERDPTLAYATFAPTTGPSDVQPLGVAGTPPEAAAAVRASKDDPLDAATLGHWTSAAAQGDGSFWIAGRHASCVPGSDSVRDACTPGFAATAARVTAAPASS